MTESNNSEEPERVMVGARVPPKKKKQIQEQLDYGDTIQDWIEDAIDRKLTEAEEGNSNTTPVIASPK